MPLHEFFSPETMELLERRAERIAVPLQEEDKVGHIAALQILIQGEKYALPLDAIAAVSQDVAIVPVPCVPSFVAGITNLRGHLISVLDLAVLLGLEPEDTADISMVVAESGDASIGFRVEAIGEVVELALHDINPVPADFTGAEYIQGIFPDGTALLTMRAILEDPHLVVDYLGDSR